MYQNLLMRNHIWWITTRPKTLIASASPVLIGTVLASNSFSLLTFIVTLSTALLIQIGTNFANDYYDFLQGADQDRKGPKRGIHLGTLSPQDMLRATTLTFTTALLLSTYLIWIGGWPILFFALLAPILGIGYTKGRYSLAYLGLGDPVVLIFFGPIAVLLTYYLQTHTWSLLPCLAGLAPGMISTAILAIANVRDVDEDIKTGKKTIPVRFGKWVGICEYTTLLLAAPLIPLYLVLTTASHYGSLLAPLSLLPAFLLLRNPTLPKATLFLWTYTALFCLGWIF